METDAASQRKGRLLRDGRYGENAAGKWVRSGAFREIDYDPENPDKLREFDNFDAAFAFDEECRLNGTGGRKAVHLPKPKDTVPKDQLALDMSFAEPSYGLRDHTYEADCKLEKREAGAKVGALATEGNARSMNSQHLDLMNIVTVMQHACN
jgi:hypothetical protein